MSYLNLPSINLADFPKGTISLWFRYSSDAVAQAIAHGADYEPPDLGDFAVGPSIFRYTIPLVTFGRKVMAHNYGAVAHPWPGPEGVGVGALTFDSVQKEDTPAEPSHLGLDAGADVEDAALKMVFQMETRAQVQGLVTEATDIHYEIDPASGQYEQHQVVKDISYIRVGTPETFRIVPQFNVTTDEWHHLLVSFDFSTSVDVVAIPPGSDNVERDAVKSTCKFWYAFDDQNKDGEDNMGESWAHHDPNDVIPIHALLAAEELNPVKPVNTTGELYDPEYHWTASGVPMNGGPVGLPASSDYVGTIYHVELAEFQFFAGLVIDTGNTQARRFFIDAEGKPVKPEDTEKMLGVRPDILLHKTGNWQQGKNTGATGLTRGESEQIIAGGQFNHTGRIEKYKPDPSL